jgi:hypothetical protein
VKDWFRLWLPWLFLPHEVILKQEDPHSGKSFDAERNSYLSLFQWWDILLPHYYGETFCVKERRRAHILSEAKGIQLSQVPERDHENAFRELEKTYHRISEYGIVHGDPVPQHVFIHKHGAMLIDWNLAEFTTSGEAKTINLVDFNDMKRMIGLYKA